MKSPAVQKLPTPAPGKKEKPLFCWTIKPPDPSSVVGKHIVLSPTLDSSAAPKFRNPINAQLTVSAGLTTHGEVASKPAEEESFNTVVLAGSESPFWSSHSSRTQGLAGGGGGT